MLASISLSTDCPSLNIKNQADVSHCYRARNHEPAIAQRLVKVQSYSQSTTQARAMAYEEQTKDIRVNIPNSLSSLSVGGANSGLDPALGVPSHGQLPYRPMKTTIFRKYDKTALPQLQITYSGVDLKHWQSLQSFHCFFRDHDKHKELHDQPALEEVLAGIYYSCIRKCNS